MSSCTSLRLSAFSLCLVCASLCLLVQACVSQRFPLVFLCLLVSSRTSLRLSAFSLCLVCASLWLLVQACVSQSFPCVSCVPPCVFLYKLVSLRVFNVFLCAKAPTLFHLTFVTVLLPACIRRRHLTSSMCSPPAEETEPLLSCAFWFEKQKTKSHGKVPLKKF